MHTDSEQANAILQWNHCLTAVAKTKDKALFMTFYDHFAPRLTSWLLGLCKDPSLAEELAQEALLTVWRKADQYDADKAAASTWVFRIGRNLYLDHTRRQKVRDRAAVIMMDEDEPETPEINADAERLQQAIKALPVQQAQVLYKSYFEGKSHQEIASDMDLPLGSVKSSLRLAFQKLCQVLRGDDAY